MQATPSVELLLSQADTRLAELAAGGSEAAFAALVVRHERSLGRYCQRVSPGGLADDVLQHAFLGLWTALRSGQQIRDVPAWLHRVARNTAFAAARRGGRGHTPLRDLPVQIDAPDVVLERRRLLLSALAAVAGLPSAQREALVRTALHGSTRAQVAAELGLSTDAVGALLHRARTGLRKATAPSLTRAAAAPPATAARA